MPTETHEIRDAQAQFTELIPRVIAGTEVVLTDDGRPVVRLVPIAGARGGVRQAGLHGGPSRWLSISTNRCLTNSGPAPHEVVVVGATEMKRAELKEP
jgi:prevent-host-death family protein